MYAVFECQECGCNIEDPPSLPSKCECGSKDFKLDLEKSSGLPEEMIEKARPQVIESRIEAEKIFEEPRKTDNRGRVTLGPEYKNQEVKVAVIESK